MIEGFRGVGLMILEEEEEEEEEEAYNFQKLLYDLLLNSTALVPNDRYY